MTKRILLFSFILLLKLSANGQVNNYDYLYKNLPFTMAKIETPSIPNRTVNVADYGAKGDGMTLCTEAFKKAIDDLSKQGGGILNIGQGVWLTGPITLQSHINLHLEAGAIILFSPDKNLYPLVETIYEGAKAMRRQSPLTGINVTDIAITGKGVIDGNGQWWRPLKKDKTNAYDWKSITTLSNGSMVDNGKAWLPEGDRSSTRANLVKLISCSRILLQGVTFRNSAAWNIHPVMCNNLTVDGVSILNEMYAQNGDGIDIESCRGVIFVNNTVDAGDDAICIKSGKDEEGRKRGMPTEDVIVDNCTVYNGHGGFVVGSEMSGGARNIAVSNCQFIGTDNGLRFKSTRGRGGVVEKIFIRNISMLNIQSTAILFNLYYASNSKNGNKVEAVPVNEGTPSFRDITVDNVTCNGCEYGFFFNGLPEMPIKNIKLNNISITSRKEPVFNYCENIQRANINSVVLKPTVSSSAQ